MLHPLKGGLLVSESGFVLIQVVEVMESDTVIAVPDEKMAEEYQQEPFFVRQIIRADFLDEIQLRIDIEEVCDLFLKRFL